MPANIFILPPELLEEIFRHLSKANDRRRVAQVCRTFYKIIRRQSKKFSTLYLTKTVPKKSPVHFFENSTTFPFSKLHVEIGSLEIQDQDFWQERGQYITEITINGRFPFHWLSFFPYLKKLKLDWFSMLLIEENCPKIQLPIEELCIEYGFNMDEICHILQRCPSLKSIKLPMGTDHFKRCAELLPWIESIETVKVDVEVRVELKEIVDLPSKVVLQRLDISSGTSVETIASFFNSPRHIETLRLKGPYNTELQFTKNKILPLLKAESIKNLVLYQIPEFPESFDLLAQVTGLQKISISLGKNIFLPHYWSSPNTANKIHEIEFYGDLCPEALYGLSSLSSLTINYSKGNLEGVQNHPSLKRLVVRSFDYGCGDLEPISSLHDLEILELNLSPITSTDSFKTFIRFPKLKKLFIDRVKMKNDFAMLLPENCPNLDDLCLKRISSVDRMNSLNDSGFEHLIRALPYLKKIEITGSGSSKSVSYKKVQQMKMEFPYLKINV